MAAMKLSRTTRSSRCRGSSCPRRCVPSRAAPRASTCRGRDGRPRRSPRWSRDHAALRAHLYDEDGQAALLRQRLHERRGRPLPREGRDAASRAQDALSIVPSIAGGARAGRASAPAGAVERGDPPLRAPPHHAGGRARGAEEAQGGARARSSARAGSARRSRSTSPRRASARSGSSTSTSSTTRTCSARSSSARATSGSRSSRPRPARLAGPQPERRGRARSKSA